MFVDCGGQPSQLYAASPRPAVQALYCTDPRIIFKVIRAIVSEDSPYLLHEL